MVVGYHSMKGKLTKKFLFTLLVLVLIALTGLVIYANTFQSPFIFDDIGAIVNNPDRRELDLSLSNWLGRRAIPYLTFDLNYRFGQLNLPGYHAVNIAIHIISAWGVFGLVYYLSRAAHKTSVWQLGNTAIDNHQGLALLAGLLFAVHPIQTQAVTYVIQRLASLAAMFYIGAMFFYVKFRLTRSRWWAGWAGLSLLFTWLAMNSKEIAITLPVAIAGLEFVFFSRRWFRFLRRIPKLLPWLVMIAVIPMYMTNIFGGLWSEEEFFNERNSGAIKKLGGGLGVVKEWEEEATVKEALQVLKPTTAETDDISRKEYLLTEFNVIRTYIRLVFLPINQNLDYDYLIASRLLELRTVLSLLFLLAVLAVAVIMFFKGLKMAAAGIFFFFLALSVESSFFPIKDVIFEHRLYLPMVGFVLFVVGISQWLVSKWGEKKNFFRGFVGTALLILLVLAGATYARNRVWSSEVSLWEDIVEKSPGLGRPKNNLGMHYVRKGNIKVAKEQFRSAIEVEEGYAEPRNNLGMIYIREGRLAEAEKILEEAIGLKENYTHAYNNLGAVYIEQGRLEDAEAMFRKAVNSDKGYVEARENLGMVLVRQERYEEAEEEFLEVLKIDLERVASLNSLGVIYARQGNTKKAIEYFEKALELNPGYAQARNNLNYFRKGKVETGLNMLN